MSELTDMADTRLARAAEWMAEVRAGALTGEKVAAFEAWLAADPANRAAFAEMQAIWDEAGEIGDDPTILALRELNQRTFNRLAGRRLAGGALAACLAVAVAGGWIALREPRAIGVQPAPAAEEQVLRTDTGQTTTAILKDGSTVVMDSDTVVRASETAGQRSIQLERGGAFFQVAKDPTRPFVVSAAGKTITALGTAFEARIVDGKLDVTLIEGKVKVEEKKKLIWQGEQKMDLQAGWRLSAPADRHWSLERIDAGKELSWMSGRLTFFNDSLEDAVAKVNRYSDRKIVLDPALERAPIVGVFEAGDTARFVRGMELAGIARVARETETTIELAPVQQASRK